MKEVLRSLYVGVVLQLCICLVMSTSFEAKLELGVRAKKLTFTEE